VYVTVKVCIVYYQQSVIQYQSKNVISWLKFFEPLFIACKNYAPLFYQSSSARSYLQDLCAIKSDKLDGNVERKDYINSLREHFTELLMDKLKKQAKLDQIFSEYSWMFGTKHKWQISLTGL